MEQERQSFQQMVAHHASIVAKQRLEKALNSHLENDENVLEKDLSLPEEVGKID